MEILILIAVIVCAFVAWKVLTGIIKLGVIALLVAGGAYLWLGGYL